MERGKLISLEGIDGVGKTSCAYILCEMLNLEKKCKYINRKMLPVDSDYIRLHMEYLYAILWRKGEVFSKAPDIEYNGFNREHWRYLMLAWYSAFEQHMILPVLEQGITIVTDGYVYKEIVKAIYSSGHFDTEKEFDFLLKPDIVFYLTAAPGECIRENSNTNRVESGAFVGIQSDFVKHQTKMKAIYDHLAADHKWIAINRNRDVNVTCNEIMRSCKGLLCI